MTAEVETLTKTRDNLLTQSERLVIQTTKLEKEIVEHRQQINSNKNTIQQLEKLKQRKFYISSCIALTSFCKKTSKFSSAYFIKKSKCN